MEFFGSCLYIIKLWPLRILIIPSTHYKYKFCTLTIYNTNPSHQKSSPSPWKPRRRESCMSTSWPPELIQPRKSNPRWKSRWCRGAIGVWGNQKLTGKATTVAARGLWRAEETWLRWGNRCQPWGGGRCLTWKRMWRRWRRFFRWKF